MAHTKFKNTGNETTPNLVAMAPTQSTATKPVIKIKCAEAIMALQVLNRFYAGRDFGSDNAKLHWDIARLVSALRTNSDVIAGDELRSTVLRRHGTDIGAAAQAQVDDMKAKLNEAKASVKLVHGEEQKELNERIKALEEQIARQSQVAMAQRGQFIFMPGKEEDYNKDYAPVVKQDIELAISKLSAGIKHLPLAPGQVPNDLIALLPFVEED